MGSGALTVLAVDAPVMHRGRHATYREGELHMLTKKVLLIFSVAKSLQSPAITSGLLGGGAFRNNRPLILLLHMLLHDGTQPLHFHYPIFWAFGACSTVELEQRILAHADVMMQAL